MKLLDERNVFETTLKNVSRAELGGLLKEYLAESNHGGWEGYQSRDITGIRRFLGDLMAYRNGLSEDERKALGSKITNVNPVP